MAHAWICDYQLACGFTNLLNAFDRVVTGAEDFHIFQVHSVALGSIGELKRKGVKDKGLDGGHLIEAIKV